MRPLAGSTLALPLASLQNNVPAQKSKILHNIILDQYSVDQLSSQHSISDEKREKRKNYQNGRTKTPSC